MARATLYFFFVKIFVQNFGKYPYFIWLLYYVSHVKYLYILTFSLSFIMCPMFYNLLGPPMSITDLKVVNFMEFRVLIWGMKLASLVFMWIVNLVDHNFLSIYNQPTTTSFKPNHNHVTTAMFAAEHKLCKPNKI